VTIGGTVFPIPASNNNALTFAELGTAGTRNYTSQWFGADAMPRADVRSYVGNFEQDLWAGVQLFADGVYSNRDYWFRLPRGGMSMTVPHTNPYSPCNPLNAGPNPQAVVCSGTSASVTYNYAADFPPLRDGYERMFNVTAGLRFDLPKEWKAEAYVAMGGSSNRSNNFVINTSRLNAALAGNGTATGSSVPGLPAFNPFCGTVSCNDQGTLDYVGAYNNNGHNFERTMYSTSLNGPLSFLTLPGGPVRLAVGAEYYRDVFENIVNRNDRTAAGTPVFTVAKSPIRKVTSVYGEIYLPLVGEEKGVPLVHSFELTIAGRFEDYSDVGETSNPKFGFNWAPVAEVNIHGSIGTSFHAPSIGDLNPANTVGLQGRTLAGSSITAAGYTGPTGTVSIAAPIGGNSVLVPETARTYSLGLDWRPERFAPGLELGFNWYQVTYENRVGTQAYDVGPAVGLNDPVYSAFVIKNPRFWTNSTVSEALFDQLLTSLYDTAVPVPVIPGAYTQYSSVVGRAPSGAAADPLQVLAIIDGRRNNTGIIETSGIDFTASYTRQTDWGSWYVGGVATWVQQFDLAPVPGSPSEELAGMFTGPMTLSGRAQFGAEVGGFSGTVFVNYQMGYDVARKYIPPAAPSQYLQVESLTTVDLTLSYESSSDLGGGLNDIRFTFGVQNLLDTDPPLVLNNTSPAVLFDPKEASALGRELSFMISKRF
jgi:iron complex outermembrane receptor protein